MRNRIPRRIHRASGGVFALLLGLTLLHGAAAAALDVDGVFGLYPVEEQTCLAVQIDLDAGRALAGLRWYNNDGSTPFPRLLLMEGQAGSPPDLAETALILREITGESLAWGEVTLDTPVVSSTNTVFAVFVFPVGQQMQAEGTGGGPGIGYWHRAGGRPSYLTLDGNEWVRFDPRYAVAVEPTLVSLKGVAALLSSLKGSQPSVQQPPPRTAPTGSETALLPPLPNPFNPSVQIRFVLKGPSWATLVVYNARGERIRELLAQPMPAGEHAVSWEGVDDRGRGVASGVYFVVLEAGAQRLQQRLSLVR